MTMTPRDGSNTPDKLQQQMNNGAMLNSQAEGDCDITVGARQQLSKIGAYIEEMLQDEAHYVDDDVHRITGLIHDSMVLLQNSFGEVMAKTQAQSISIVKLIDCLQKMENAGNDNIADSENRKKVTQLLNQLSESSGDINSEINDSIRALQFEDITQQLTAHILKRLEHIKQIALVAHTDIASASKEEELKCIANRVQAMRDEFKRMNIKDIVQQRDMSEGDIDLF